MNGPRVVIKSSPHWTRLLVTFCNEELMRAALPSPTVMSHPKAAATLLEGMSLWLGRQLSVVLCADAEGSSSALGLCDGLGFGNQTVHFEVEVVDPRRRPRRLATFRDLRQLELRHRR